MGRMVDPGNLGKKKKKKKKKKLARSYLNWKKSWVWWYTPVIPAIVRSIK
jgi:hypothetical protein